MKPKVLAKDHEVTCLVLENSAEYAIETSLAENFHRLATNPADEARTGWTVGGGVEYRYTEVGDHDVAYGSTGPNGVLQVSRPNFTDSAFLAKVNFRFTTLPHM